MTINYGLTGKDRKNLVTALEEILGEKATYDKVPSCSYSFEKLKVTKDGALDGDGRFLAKVIPQLREKGFEPLDPIKDMLGDDEDDDEIGLCINLPRSFFKEGAIERVKQLVASKETLLKHALNVDSLDIIEEEKEINFPWFPEPKTDEEHDAYLHLTSALCKAANEQKRVTGKDKEVENEKYAFRCFLLKLGFIGDDFKSQRKFLLRNLTGSSAFKNGRPAKEEE